MKKLLVLMLSLMLVACSSNTSEPTTEVAAPTNDAKVINVYTRDASSGTREAFEKATGYSELTKDAIEVSSNGDMVSKIANDDYGIGYVSLSTDFEANNLKPLTLDGVVPSVETVLDGSYAMQRSFSYVTRAAGDYETEDKEELVKAFLDFMNNSLEGKAVVEAAGGIVDTTNALPWSELANKYPVVTKDNSAITIVTCGSTSVTKTLQAALEAFVPMAGNFNFTMNQTGSSDGHKRVLGDEKDGVNRSDIGFASRNFKSEEDVTNAMESGQYCIDAVVAVVNNNNSLSDVTLDDLNNIYSGTVTTYSELNKYDFR